jgi:hypothetical protein
MRLRRIALIVAGPRHAHGPAHLCRAGANARPEDRGALAVRAAGGVIRRVRGVPRRAACARLHGGTKRALSQMSIYELFRFRKWLMSRETIFRN